MKKLSILLTSLLFSFNYAQLQSYEVASSTQIAELNASNGVIEACETSVMYDAEGGEGIFIGDFTPIIVANDFVVSANTSFQLQELEIYPTTGSGGVVESAEIFIYSNMVDEDGESHPGVLIAQQDLEPSEQFVLQEISFTSGELATEHFATFDLTSFEAIDGGTADETYWIGYRVSPTITPLRYLGIISLSDPNTNFSTDDGITFGGLATSTDSRSRDLPYVLRGDCSTMGVSDLNNSTVSIYPNPVKDILNVSAKNAEVKEVSVTNLNGQVVATAKTSSINVSTLPAGVYVVKVVDAKGNVSTTKIVKK